MTIVREEFNKSIAKAIKQERINKGISQTTMTLDTGINMSRLETGKYSIELITFIRICDFLGINPGETIHKG